jgi:apolipoprotein N-acyltransferase
MARPEAGRRHHERSAREVAASGFVLTAVVLSAWATLTAEPRDLRPVAAGAAFATCFFLALRGVPWYFAQLALVLLLVALSLALHLLCLPAGLCCFVALMACRNDALLPARPPPRPAVGQKSR